MNALAITARREGAVGASTNGDAMWFDTRMELQRHSEVQHFLAAAGVFLGEREAAHNLIFGICSSLEADPSMAEGKPYFVTVADRDTIVAAALRTPPWNLVLSEVDDPAALDAIADDLVRDAAGQALPGVIGPADMVGTFADRWTARTGRRGRIVLAERAFQLTRVRPPRPVPGEMRRATQADRDLLVRWLIDFEAEALSASPSPVDPAASVDRWLANGSGRINYLWEDGEARSWCGVSGPTPHGIRIGPVYTPREWRGQGYASVLVAQASQAQLDAGRQFCFLYTDLANPTSNHIYAEIGYEPVGDASVVTFD